MGKIQPIRPGNLRPSECIPGTFYLHKKYKRVLCCGSSDLRMWVVSFAVRNVSGETNMKYLGEHNELMPSYKQKW